MSVFRRSLAGIAALAVVAVFLLARPPEGMGQTSGAALGPLRGAGGLAATGSAEPLASATPGRTTRRTVVPRRSRFPEATLRELKANATSAPRGPRHVEDAGAPSPGARSVLPSAPSAVASFSGIPETPFIPPDTILAAGPNHVVEMVNSAWRAFTKSGTAATGLTEFCGPGGFWTSVLPAGVTECFDPKVAYDQYSGRWILLALAVDFPPAAQGSWYLLATSLTSDPTGLWCTRLLDATLNGSTPTSNWADFPGLGLDSQAIYITSNQFSLSTFAFQYAKLRILNKSEVYGSCGSIGWTDFVDLRDPVITGFPVDTVQPAHSYGNPAAEYLLSTGASTNNVVLWSVTNPVTSPTLTGVSVTTPSSWGVPPNAAQCSATTLLDTADGRLLNTVYRYGELWTTHTVACSGLSCLRLLRIKPIGAPVTSGTVLDDFTFGAAGTFFYYPAVDTDIAGNVYVVFNRSSSSECAGVRYTGRKSSEPANSLQASALLQAGVSSYVVTDNRFGDYSGAAPDPAVPNRAWFAGEYVAATNTWGTWIGSAEFAPTFADVPITDFGFASAEQMRARNITAGCSVSPLLYCPDQNVLRRQMAIFIIRAMGVTPPTSCAGTFADVPATDLPYCRYIEKMVDLGITSGCAVAPLRFCPDQNVLRRQMAIFIIKGMGVTPPASCAGTFADVPATDLPWCRYIEEMYNRGITAGCAPALFCPNNSVTRREMAVFIIRAFFP